MFKIVFIGLSIFLLAGCSIKNTTHSFNGDDNKLLTFTEAREATYNNQLVYNNNFYPELAKPRKVWFPPEISKNNVVIGERTLILPPKKIIWKNQPSKTYEVVHEQEIYNNENIVKTQEDDFDKEKIILPSNISKFISEHK